jgi:NAD(P)-dependent dehydrogenase (short-subunit alcohol dehydrogenase family)
MEHFENKVAVVTGAASGIGLALAERFVAEGMRVVLADVEAPALEDVAAKLAAGGAEVEARPTDVADMDQVQALADHAIERFGAVHVVCNNAGVGGGGVSWEMPLSTWQWMLGVNLWGVVHGVKAFVPHLVRQGEPAHVVNTASVAGLVAAPFMGPYNASKHAVVAISETLHHELAMLAPHVGVSVLCPGWVNTRIFDSARNRPEHLREDAPDEAGPAAMLQQVLQDAMAPATVAGKVLAAIRAGQFWVLTHDDEADFWVDAVNRRLRSVEQRENPALGLPG